MASESDYDWGDDFLDGDMDFDFDFDGNKDQGFLKSVSKGFLSALKSNTVGDTDTKIKTLRRILPSSFGTTFDFYRELDRKKQEAFKEFKENSVDLMGDLAFLSGSLSESLRDRLPNKIVDGLEEFSKKDFSDWEKTGEFREEQLRMGDVEEDTQQRMLEALEQQSVVNVESTDAITRVMSSVGSKQLSAGLQNNEQLFEVNANLQRLYQYQMKVHGQREAMKLNLMTRQYLTNAKYYKFMEASQHRIIKEIKDVVKNTAMSDFEKTSVLQASKGRLRDNILKSTFSRAGGFGEALGNIISKDGVNDSLSIMTQLVGDVRFASEMSADAGVSPGEIIGSMLGQFVVDRGPEFFETKAGRDLIAKVRAKYPDQAKLFDKTQKELRQFGDLLSYSTKAMGSVMGRHYQETGMMDQPHMTYEEYLEELPPNAKPMPKLLWQAVRKATGAAGGAFNLVGENYQESQGSVYQIKEKSLKDLKNNSVWSVHDSRSLTEEIPALLSEIHHSIEKIRTGSDDVPRLRYDYRTSRVTTTDRLNQQIQRMITPEWELNTYADAAKSIAGDIDKDNELSESASNALAQRLAREADKGNVFNPYDYIGIGTDEYMNEEQAAEIEALVRRRFSITDEMIERTQDSTLDGLMARLTAPTPEGQELLHRLSLRTDSLKNYTPNIADKIDLVRSLGLDEGLKASGFISVDPDSNKEIVNQELIWKQLNNRINGNPINEDLSIGSDEPYPTKDDLYQIFHKRNNKSSPNLSNLSIPSPLPLQEEVSGALSNIIDTLVKIQNNTKTLPAIGVNADPTKALVMDPLLDLVKGTNSTLAEISQYQMEQISLLKKLKSVSTVGIDEDQPSKEITDQQRVEEREKQSLLERLRSVVPADLFNQGVEALIANKPMVLGGLLGGLGVTAMSNPKAAALLAGGAAVATAYGQLSKLGNAGSSPAEDEDLYDEDGNEVLYAAKKNAGDYYDQASRKVIKSWADIKGTVIDVSQGASEIAASGKRLAGRLFGPDGREIILDGLHRFKSFVSKTFQAIDPVGKAKSLIDKAKTGLDQMDVYRKGDPDPVLTSRGFKNGWYFDEEGNEILGWRDILGPVYDQEGNLLVSVEDLNDLQTIGGVSLGKARSATGTFGKMVSKGAKWLQENGRERLGSAILGSEHVIERAGNIGGDRYEPITHRLDSIYGLIAGHWGLDTKMPGMEKVSPKVKSFIDDLGTGEHEDEKPTEGIRLNSLADKIRRKKEAKQAQFQDSVIDIAESLNPDDKDGKKKQDGGILGKLLGMAGGGLFALMKKFLSLGIGGFTNLMKLNGTITKGLFSLGKLLSSALLGRRTKDAVVDGIGGADGDGRRGKRGKRGRFGRFSKLGRMSNMTKFGLGGALMLGGDMAIDAARDGFDVEQGSTADKLLDYGSVGLEAAGWLATGSAVAGMAGTSLGGIAAAAAPFLLNPITLGVAGVGLAGYAAYKFFSSDDLTIQQKLRMAQYGIDDQDEELINDVLRLETQLQDYVQLSGSNAGFSRETPLERFITPFLNNRKTQQGQQDTLQWFSLRFKPVYLSYYAQFQKLDINKFEDYDKLKNNTVPLIAKQTHDEAGMMNPSPYRIQLWISRDTYALSAEETKAQVARYLNEMKEEYDTTNLNSKKLSEDLTIDTVNSKIKKVEKAGMLESAWMRLTGDHNDEEKQKKLDTWFKQPEVIKGIDISDMLPGDKPVEIITAFRLAAYGNEDNMPWRVEAVLKLERWMERYTSYSNGRSEFTGTVEEFWATFSAAFRVTSRKGRELAIRWFQYRFLPVWLAWHQVCRNQRGGDPSKVWRTLSATAQFRFAQQVVELKVFVDERVKGLFSVDEAPFEGERSEGMSTRVKRMLQALEVKANQARLKDPDLEQSRTVKAPDRTDQSVYRLPDNLNINKPKNAPDISEQFGRKQPSPVPEMTSDLSKVKVDVNRDIETDVKLKPGDDKGVSLNKDQITKVLIREMVKKGYDDPRQIAEMLALTDYETGGYRNTAENMRYTNAARARNIFRKLKQFNIPQIQEIIRQGPVAFANAVYNGWLGNTDSPNDGWLYRGRGLVQLTGKDNYERAASDLGIDIVNNPRMVSEDPETMAKTAIWFFENSPQMQSIKEHGDFSFAARGLNGGKALPGMGKRERLYNDYLNNLLNGELTKDLAPSEEENTPYDSAPGMSETEKHINDYVDNHMTKSEMEDRVGQRIAEKSKQYKNGVLVDNKFTRGNALASALPKDSLAKEERALTATKPSATPSLEDNTAAATSAVKQSRNPSVFNDKSIPDLSNVPTPTKPKVDEYNIAKEAIEAQVRSKVKEVPQEPLKVEAAMKPETEAALTSQTAILQGILNAIQEGNQKANRVRQDSVSLT
ncbi:hypothetical protein [Photobacterium phage PDCC-1]|uniref:Glycoside hydrolase family 19 catalytic domain-containing protein n=1 Tax=Photobacterium phage PDCC-1 TaxID=2664246 RepID=A0A6B9J8A7_9CAUD|nr:tail fiber protein [Photobacterium phage PDCC-1]QGZ14511.1 hypothetical protein [Photobacterium phage PDCC-1]